MNQEHPITKEIYHDLIKPRIVEDPETAPEDFDPYTSFTWYCVGLETYFYRGHQIVKHDGLISGFSSLHFFMPRSSFGGVILGNSASVGELGNILLHELVDELLDVRREQRVDWNAHELRARDEVRNKKKSNKLGCLESCVRNLTSRSRSRLHFPCTLGNIGTLGITALSSRSRTTSFTLTRGIARWDMI